MPKPRDRHRFGSHLSIAGGLSNALREARRLTFGTVQVFVKNQRQWRAPPLKPDDLAEWHALQSAEPLGPLVAHATYLINLASADPALHARSRDAFAEELRRCDQLAIPYLVVHPGAAGESPRAEAIGRVAQALNEIFAAAPTLKAMPLLETTAGQGTTLGRTFVELAEIIAGLHQPRRVGVCVDTCHVFAAGYDIRTAAGYAALVAEAREAVGLERIRCWHLNDSRGELGSHLDRHEHIGKGRIGPAGFGQVLRDERFIEIPMILETPKETDERGREWDAVNLAALRRLSKRPRAAR